MMQERMERGILFSDKPMCLEPQCDFGLSRKCDVWTFFLKMPIYMPACRHPDAFPNHIGMSHAEIPRHAHAAEYSEHFCSSIWRFSPSVDRQAPFKANGFMLALNGSTGVWEEGVGRARPMRVLVEQSLGRKVLLPTLW